MKNNYLLIIFQKTNLISFFILINYMTNILLISISKNILIMLIRLFKYISFHLIIILFYIILHLQQGSCSSLFLAFTISFAKLSNASLQLKLVLADVSI